VITDLGVLRPDPETHQLTLTAVHPGVALPDVLANTGWDLAVASDLETSRAPSPMELTTLRGLQERSARAHRR
jgi:glutaconate CoA-transferase subunit B